MLVEARCKMLQMRSIRKLGEDMQVDHQQQVDATVVEDQQEDEEKHVCSVIFYA